MRHKSKTRLRSVCSASHTTDAGSSACQADHASGLHADSYAPAAAIASAHVWTMTLAKRRLASAGWNVIASLIQLVVQAVRMILLSRLLPVETFGVYAWASSLVGLSLTAANFGIGGAFLHRAAETGDEQQAAAVPITVKLLFTVACAILLASGAWMFATGDVRSALLVLVAINLGVELTQTRKLRLTHRVSHRRLALLQVGQ